MVRRMVAYLNACLRDLAHHVGIFVQPEPDKEESPSRIVFVEDVEDAPRLVGAPRRVEGERDHLFFLFSPLHAVDGDLARGDSEEHSRAARGAQRRGDRRKQHHECRRQQNASFFQDEKHRSPHINRSCGARSRHILSDRDEISRLLPLNVYAPPRRARTASVNNRIGARVA